MWVFKNNNEECPICKGPIFGQSEDKSTPSPQGAVKPNSLQSIAIEAQLIAEEELNRIVPGRSRLEMSASEILIPENSIAEDYCLPVRANLLESDIADLRMTNCYKRLVVNFPEVYNIEKRKTEILDMLETARAIPPARA